MATHSSVLAWRIPGTGEPGGVPSMGSHRVGHNWSDLAAAAVCICWASQVALVVWKLPATAGDVRDAGSIPGLGRCPGGEHGNPLQFSWLADLMDKGAWQVTVHGVTKSRTWLSNFTFTSRCRITYLYTFQRAFQVALVVKNPPANARDVRDAGSIPGLGRSSGGGHGNPLQDSYLENPMDRGA